MNAHPIDTVEQPEPPAAPRRPVDAAALLFVVPPATVLLLRSAHHLVHDVIRHGPVGLLLAGLAMVLLVGQCLLVVRAGVSGLRGNGRGVDLAATAVLVSLSACVLLFVAGVRMDYLGSGIWLLAALVIGMLRLDGAAANAWYAQVTERAATEAAQPVARIRDERLPLAA